MIPVVERQKGMAITPLLPHEKVAQSSNAHRNTKPPAKPGQSFRPTISSEKSLSASPTSEESLPHITRPSLDALSAVSHVLSEPTADKNSSGISTSVTSVYNSREINTSTNVELKVPHNQHLHNNGHGAGAQQRRE